VVQWLFVEGMSREIFDVIAFPGVRRPMAYGIVGSELSEAVWIDSAGAVQGGSRS
jgi:hypothetical protein